MFRERRAAAGDGVLPLTMNYRSRPEVLAVVNQLFGADFGDEFQPLTASGDFPDPVFGAPVELLVTDKSTYSESDVHWRRGEARAIARRIRDLIDAGDATPSEIVLLFAAGTDAEWYEEELRALGVATYRGTGRGTSASSRWWTCSRTCVSCATGTTMRRSSACSPRRSSVSRTMRSFCCAVPRPSGRSSSRSSASSGNPAGARRAAAAGVSPAV